MKRNTKKPTKKDLIYNIALNKRLITEISQRLMWLEEVIYKYMDMKKDTKKFNKYLQTEIKQGAEEKTKDTKKTS